MLFFPNADEMNPHWEKASFHMLNDSNEPALSSNWNLGPHKDKTFGIFNEECALLYKEDDPFFNPVIFAKDNLLLLENSMVRYRTLNNIASR